MGTQRWGAGLGERYGTPPRRPAPGEHRLCASALQILQFICIFIQIIWIFKVFNDKKSMDIKKIFISIEILFNEKINHQ